LLSTVQMPPGIPVATVGVDVPANAAFLAMRILALENPLLEAKLEQAKESVRLDFWRKLRKLQEDWSYD
jgi:5-(carboxyamino)imidazole ribonucleotide mutase